ncbi:DgyrCDS10640 [Dimorphilus gyrociliatus]|uniref:DgyrCDS10640 n=1 Tax=Dimorphilus gyrociliatus TaxID=2664684 RepID=A0A7I8W5X0_9ANNE|nr:DgyrCDS10640 [Dimorphilus gyrociliatus]
MPHIQRPSSVDDRSVAIATFTIEASLVLLNILPLLTVLVVKKERRSTDELIAALSVNDILGVLLPLPARLTSFIRKEWKGGRIACQLYQLTVHWTQLNGMCLLTLICIDRFLSVRYSIERKTPYSNGKIRIIAILISFTTLFVSCLPLMGLAPIAFKSKLCRSWLIAEASDNVQRVFYAVFIAVASSNLLVAFACNAKTVKDVYSMKDSLTDQRQVAEFSLLIAVVTIVFYLAWFPVLKLANREGAQNEYCSTSLSTSVKLRGKIKRKCLQCVTGI